MAAAGSSHSSNILATLLCIAFLITSVSLPFRSEVGSASIFRTLAPPRREFISLPQPFRLVDTVAPPPIPFRVLQFNVLADGLSGLREDKGSFANTDPKLLDWESRKYKLLGEIIQYSPDIVTMQEVDHYNDFFLPELQAMGYIGVYSPKPLSACLFVSNSSDGCALFISEKRFRIISSESITLALTKAELVDGGELNEEDIYIRAQNQVALITVCEVYPNADELASPIRFDKPPLLVIANTHLKSSKSATGERYREKEVTEVLKRIEMIASGFKKIGRDPAVLFCGSFNAVPEPAPYSFVPLTYRALKSHKLGLRSVYNEDLVNIKGSISGGELYTTWKAKLYGREGYEKLTKRYSDYIFYAPFRKVNLPVGISVPLVEIPQGALLAGTLARQAVPSLATMSLRFLLRAIVYLLSSVILSACILESNLQKEEKAAVVSSTIAGLVFFELTTGSMLQLQATDDSNPQKNVTDLPASDFGNRIFGMFRYPTTKAMTDGDGRLLLYVRNIFPLLQPLELLDLYDSEKIGESGLVSSGYPSDHLAIVSTFQMEWDLSASSDLSAVDSAGKTYTLANNRKAWVQTSSGEEADSAL